MKEKQFSHWLGVWVVIILAGFVAVNAMLSAALDNALYVSIPLSGGGQEYTLQDLSFHTDVTNFVVVRDVEQTDDALWLQVEPAVHKKTAVISTLEVSDKNSGEVLGSVNLRVARSGLLLDMSTGNFSHYRVREACMTAFIFAIAVLLWV